jgi:YegS/Rv2252/BmrU family lipid kinase
MTSTLVLLNPYANSGRAPQLWDSVQHLAQNEWGNLIVAVTHQTHEIPDHLHQAHSTGVSRVIAVGGDGTSHMVTNHLLQHSPSMIFGQLPIGTGQDFARTLKIPDGLDNAVRWIGRAIPTALDLGLVQYDDKRRYFLNIASVGISGEVDKRVNRTASRHPWTFPAASLQTMLTYQPPPMRIHVDGQLWYDGKSWLAVVANGRYFGRGMAIAPDASVFDGLFDVVVIKDVPRVRLMQAFSSVYSGNHMELDAVLYTRGRTVTIESDETLPIDLDGEYERAQSLEFSVHPGKMQMLIH